MQSLTPLSRGNLVQTQKSPIPARLPGWCSTHLKTLTGLVCRWAEVQGYFCHHCLQQSSLLCSAPALAFLIDSKALLFAETPFITQSNFHLYPLSCPSLLDSIYYIDSIHMSFLFSCNLYVKKAWSFQELGKKRQRNELFLSPFALCWPEGSSHLCPIWLLCCTSVSREKHAVCCQELKQEGQCSLLFPSHPRLQT